MRRWRNLAVTASVVVVAASLVLRYQLSGPAPLPPARKRDKITSPRFHTDRTTLPADALARVSRLLRDNRHAEAEKLLESALQNVNGNASEALFQEAVKLENDGFLQAAMFLFRKTVSIDRRHVKAGSHLIDLLYLTGQVFAAQAELKDQLQTGRVYSNQLPLLYHPALKLFRHTARLKSARAAAPRDPLPLVGLAALAINQGNDQQAVDLLKEALQLDPGIMEAWYRLRWAMHGQSGSQRVYPKWTDSGRSWRDHPGIWLVAGIEFQSGGHPNEAVRCFHEAFQLAPHDYSIASRFAAQLQALGKTVQARMLAERTRTLNTLKEAAEKLHYADDYPASLLRQLAEITQSRGRFAESIAWCDVGRAYHSEAAWPNRIARQCRILKNRADTASLEFDSTLTDSPPPALPWADYQISPPFPAEAATIQFHNVARETGVQIIFRTRDPADHSRRQFYEFTGGGVAVLDHDVDGWPDLFFTQGGITSPSLQAGDGNLTRELRDKLFWNRSGQEATEISQAACLVDFSYGQGATVGDINSDGFPDLYVGNVGCNQLFVNNGDGTFSLSRTAAFEENAAWTTSCAIMDLNRDGHPDIYDVNHATEEVMHAKMCQNDGTSQPCDSTVRTAAEQDRVFFSRGDGTFLERHVQAGIKAAEGMGLGVAAADFDSDGLLSVFIANDAKPNFFFEPVSAGESCTEYEEQAYLRGLALNELGKAQACMGIAVGDADGNGLLDLFVTNFFEDSNTLYLQSPGNVFVDSTRQAGLKVPGYQLLGFGTQFLDADLDGDLDLVLTNGDIDDFSQSSAGGARPWQQRPLLLRNRGNGTFEELPAKECGDYFEKKWLGRGLSKLDWNRDGRPDFVVSHEDNNAALLLNRTKQTGQHLVLRLVGRELSGRDAIGATATVSDGDTTVVRQLTAGDGYQACNERRLIFGFRQKDAPVELEMRWPDGTVQKFKDVALNREYTVIQGKTSLTPLSSGY